MNNDNKIIGYNTETGEPIYSNSNVNINSVPNNTYNNGMNSNMDYNNMNSVPNNNYNAGINSNMGQNNMNSVPNNTYNTGMNNGNINQNNMNSVPNNIYNPNKKNNNSIIIISLLAFVVVAIVVAILVLVLFKKDDNGNSSSNKNEYEENTSINNNINTNTNNNNNTNNNIDNSSTNNTVTTTTDNAIIFQGFKFNKNSDYIYSDNTSSLNIYSASEYFDLCIFEGGLSLYQASIESLKINLENSGYVVNEYTTKNFNNRDILYFELTYNDYNAILCVMESINPNYVYAFTVETINNDYSSTSLENAIKVLSDSTYVGDYSNYQKEFSIGKIEFNKNEN